MAGKKGRSGGARPGAGRKPKVRLVLDDGSGTVEKAGPTSAPSDGKSKGKPKLTFTLPPSVGMAPIGNEDPRAFLRRVMNTSAVPLEFRLQAAAVLVRGEKAEEPKGKKEEREAAAEKASSRFAPSAPPKLVVSR